MRRMPFSNFTKVGAGEEAWQELPDPRAQPRQMWGMGAGGWGTDIASARRSIPPYTILFWEPKPSGA